METPIPYLNPPMSSVPRRWLQPGIGGGGGGRKVFMGGCGLMGFRGGRREIIEMFGQLSDYKTCKLKHLEIIKSQRYQKERGDACE